MSKDVKITADFEAMFQALSDDGRLSGMYLAKPTGEVLEDDHTYIEVILANKSFYAKPCFGFGEWNAPNKEWLEAHKDEVMVWVGFENGNSAHPVYMGVMPLDNKTSRLPYLNGKNYISKEFSYYFDDTKKEFILSKNDKNGNPERSFEINDESVTIKDTKGSKLIIDSSTGDIDFKNSKGMGIRTKGASVVLGDAEGLESSIKGTSHIANIQSILTTMLTSPLMVAGTVASFNPAVATQLQTAISKLSSDLSNKVKLD